MHGALNSINSILLKVLKKLQRLMIHHFIWCMVFLKISLHRRMLLKLISSYGITWDITVFYGILWHPCNILWCKNTYHSVLCYTCDILWYSKSYYGILWCTNGIGWNIRNWMVYKRYSIPYLRRNKGVECHHDPHGFLYVRKVKYPFTDVKGLIQDGTFRTEHTLNYHLIDYFSVNKNVTLSSI